MTEKQLIFDFYSEYSKTDKFRTGTLVYRSQHENHKFMATSGLRHYQGIGNCYKKGRGGIPPCELIRMPNYTVSTEPIFMPKTKGIEGNFYRIFPFEVSVFQYEKKITRGDFGIHGDFNTEGTAGCIGIPPGSHWLAFQKLMNKILNEGDKSIKLFIPMPLQNPPV